VSVKLIIRVSKQETEARVGSSETTREAPYLYSQFKFIKIIS